MLKLYKNNLINHIVLVAVLGAIFLLFISILDAVIGMPTLSDLIVNSFVFQLGLTAALWFIASFIIRYLHNKDN